MVRSCRGPAYGLLLPEIALGRLPAREAELAAAHLAKADLVSQAVEFTNSRDVVGGYYAEAAGEEERCSCSHSRALASVLGDEGSKWPDWSLCENDTITKASLLSNEPPTGSSDPYALMRRAAIGVIALLRSTANLDL